MSLLKQNCGRNTMEATIRFESPLPLPFSSPGCSMDSTLFFSLNKKNNKKENRQPPNYTATIHTFRWLSQMVAKKQHRPAIRKRARARARYNTYKLYFIWFFATSGHYWHWHWHSYAILQFFNLRHSAADRQTPSSQHHHQSIWMQKQ